MQRIGSLFNGGYFTLPYYFESMYISASATKLTIIRPARTAAITFVLVLFFFIIHSILPQRQHKFFNFISLSASFSFRNI